MNMSLLYEALMIMCKGMIGIFVVIAAIWAFVALLNRITDRKEVKRD